MAGELKKEQSKTVRVYLVAASVLLLLLIGIYGFYVVSEQGKMQKSEQAPLRVLLIGGNLLNRADLPVMLRQIAANSGFKRPLAIVSTARPGAVLKQFKDDGKFPAFLDKEDRFDITVLEPDVQEVLQTPDELLYAVKYLAAWARRQGGRVTVIECWARQNEEDRQQVISSIIRRLADRLSIEVAPCGDLFYAVSRKHRDWSIYGTNPQETTASQAFLTAAAIFTIASGEPAQLTSAQPASVREQVLEPFGTDTKVLSELETTVWRLVNDENRTHQIGPGASLHHADSLLGPAGKAPGGGK